MAVGGVGVISVTANFVPKQTADMTAAVPARRLGRRRAACTTRMLPLMRALFLETNPIPIKAALAMMGFCRDELRLPLLPMSDAPRAKLRSAMQQAGCSERAAGTAEHGSGARRGRSMTSIVVCGAAGRMGRTLVTLVAQNEATHTRRRPIEAAGNPTLGKDAGEVAGVGTLGVRITDDFAAVATPDAVTLDFTAPAAALEHLRTAVQKQSPIVIGSTGFTPHAAGGAGSRWRRRRAASSRRT